MAAIVDDDACVGCAICEEKCTQQAVTVDDVAHVSTELCTDCGVCIDSCPNGAISLPA